MDNSKLQTVFQFIADQKGPAEEKYTKLKGIYSKLREEHIQLLRTVCWWRLKKKRLSPPKEPNTYKIWFTGVLLTCNYRELVNESGHTLCLDIWSTLHTAMISIVESIACKLDCKISSSWVWLIVGGSVFFLMPYTWQKEYHSISNNPAKKSTIIFNIVA